MITAEHEIDSHKIIMTAANAVGGIKILAQALGVSESYIQRQTKEESNDGNPDAYGVRTDMQRVEAAMIAMFNAGFPEVAYMIKKYFDEVYDEGMAEKVGRDVMAINAKKRTGNPWKWIGANANTVIRYFCLFI